MKRKLILAGAGLLALAALTGCGGGNQESGKLVIEFWHTFGDAVGNGVDEAARKFEKLVKDNEGVDLEIDAINNFTYQTAQSYLTPTLTAGSNCVMAVSYADTVAELMALESYDGQFVVNMEDYLTNSEYGLGKDTYLGDRLGPSDFVQSYLDEGRAFDKTGLYVLPFLKSTEVMLYNENMALLVLDDYEPTKAMTEAQKKAFLQTMSWDDLMAIGKLAYDNRVKYGFTALEYPVYYDSDSNMVITQLEQMGIDFSHKENGKVVLGLDSSANSANYAKAKALLQDLKERHDEHVLLTKQSNGGAYASDSFKQRKCIFTIGSSGGAGYSFPEAGSFTVGFARVPYRGTNSQTPNYISQGPSVTFLRNKSLSNELNNKKILYAWKFYKYLTSTQQNLILAVNKSKGYIPVKESCYSTESWISYMAKEENSSKSANIVVNVIDRHFLNSLVFKGSGKYRDGLKTLVAEIFAGKDIDTKIGELINDVKLAMKADS